MCPRISVPAPPSSPLPPPRPHPPPPAFSASISVCTCVYVCMYIYIYICIKKSHLRRICERWWATLLHRHPPSRSPSPSPVLPPLSYGSRARLYPISFSTYNLHASIVQTDDGNYLRFSANAINQKRRSASPPGPLDRQGYPPPPLRRFISLVPSTAFDSTRLRRLIIHD